MPSRQGCWPATVLGYPGHEFVARAHGVGGVAEWLRQGPAKPCTRVRFPSPPRGRLAQWESASLTPKRSLVQSQYRPPGCAGQRPVPEGGTGLKIICQRLSTGRATVRRQVVNQDGTGRPGFGLPKSPAALRSIDDMPVTSGQGGLRSRAGSAWRVRGQEPLHCPRWWGSRTSGPSARPCARPA
jgi:hypothetical protein